MTQENDITALHKSMNDMAGILTTLVKSVYKDAAFGEENEIMPPLGPIEEEGHDEMYKTHDDGDEYDESMKKNEDDDEHDDEFDNMDELMKTLTRKGYNNAASEASSEEDSRFGESPDSDIPSNEGVDPGKATKNPPFAGNREDETLNVKAMSKQIGQMSKVVTALVKGMPQDQVLVKSMVPGNGARPNGRGNDATDVVLTRDMELEMKNRTFKQINAFREQTGDLPRNVFL